MKGITRIYDHVTPAMLSQIIQALDARWLASLAALSADEQAQLVSWFPHLRRTCDRLRVQQSPKLIAILSPFDH